MSSPSQPDSWSRRAARIGRCVAKFRLTNKPKVHTWRTSRVSSGGARCIGCDEQFQTGEPHVEVVAAQTLVLELHDECFDVWTRFAQGAPPPETPPDEDEEADF